MLDLQNGDLVNLILACGIAKNGADPALRNDLDILRGKLQMEYDRRTKGARPHLDVGDLVQLSPDTTRNKMLAGCIMTITEPKPFGAQGYVQVTGTNGEPGGMAFYRAGWNEFEYCGKAIWFRGHVDGETPEGFVRE